MGVLQLTSLSYSSSPIIFIFSVITFLLSLATAQSSLCRTTCGGIPINYPFGIDDGCGSPYYRHLLVCNAANQLELRTPSGRYPVRRLSYPDPHLLVSDPDMWNCLDGDNLRRPSRPFSLDAATHFSLSSQNDYLFFNCSPERVIMQPKPIFCERFPERCDSSCDTAGYLCRHLPECAAALSESSCCSYYPKATESLRLMLQHCTAYTSVYWRNVGVSPPYDQVPEYGVRVDFDIPVTTKCLQCQDTTKGGGTCGFDAETQDFLCLCSKGNSTTYCNGYLFLKAENYRQSWIVPSSRCPEGTATAVSVAGAVGIGAAIWYLKKLRAKEPVTHGVESNENRLF
ncbi:hypothetical protein NMG60_11009857 [Bertholletia excelsa]